MSDVIGASSRVVPAMSVSRFLGGAVRRIAPKQSLLDILVSWHHLQKVGVHGL